MQIRSTLAFGATAKGGDAIRKGNIAPKESTNRGQQRCNLIGGHLMATVLSTTFRFGKPKAPAPNGG